MWDEHHHDDDAAATEEDEEISMKWNKIKMKKNFEGWMFWSLASLAIVSNLADLCYVLALVTASAAVAETRRRLRYRKTVTRWNEGWWLAMAVVGRGERWNENFNNNESEVSSRRMDGWGGVLGNGWHRISAHIFLFLVHLLLYIA